MKQKACHQVFYAFKILDGTINITAFWLRIPNYRQTHEEYKAKNKNAVVSNPAT